MKSSPGYSTRNNAYLFAALAARAALAAVLALSLGAERVTIALNASDEAEALPDIAGSPVWEDGLSGKALSPRGFAVYE